MSAGTGVYHSEHNFERHIKILQIWIFPDEKDIDPLWRLQDLIGMTEKTKWLHIVSSKDGDAQIKITQDMNIYSIELQKRKRN